MEDISLVFNENDELKVVNFKKEGVNIMKVYDLVLEMIELDNEILELSKKLSKTYSAVRREKYGKSIDRRLVRQLEIKHILENTKVI